MTEFTTALPYVTAIPPYPPGRPVDAVAREFNLDPATIVKIASNENPLGCSPLVAEAIKSLAPQSNIYPDFACYDLCHAIAAATGVSVENVLPGAGSSEIISLAVRAFLERGRAAIIPQYAFQSYEGATASVGADKIVVPARNYEVDLEGLLAAVTERTTVLFLATPNNPTGTVIDRDALDSFIDRLPAHVLLILDEAYCEYLDPADRFDSIAALKRRRNMLVMRTFSKIHGLAGLRVGYALGDTKLLSLLRRLQLPFSVSAVAQKAAIAALGDGAFAEHSRLHNKAERARLATTLHARGVEVLPSEANFLLARVGKGGALARELMARGVIVRPVDNYGLPEWLRISIGLASENDRFVEAFDAVRADVETRRADCREQEQAK